MRLEMKTFFETVSPKYAGEDSRILLIAKFVVLLAVVIFCTGAHVHCYLSYLILATSTPRRRFH